MRKKLQPSRNGGTRKVPKLGITTHQGPAKPETEPHPEITQIVTGSSATIANSRTTGKKIAEKESEKTTVQRQTRMCLQA